MSSVLYALYRFYRSGLDNELCKDEGFVDTTKVSLCPFREEPEDVNPLLFCAAPEFYQVIVSSARVTIWSPTFLKNHLPSAPYLTANKSLLKYGAMKLYLTWLS